MHETYSQIFRNVCIVFIHVCVCLYTESHRREGRRQKDRDSRDMVNESKYWQRNLHIRFMVLPSISFHKFTYCEMNTFYKYTIHFFFFEFYLIFEISAFEIHSFSRHHTQTPEVCNATWKQLSRLLTQHETYDLCTLKHSDIATGVYQTLESNPHLQKCFDFFNCVQYKRHSKSKMFIAWNPWFLSYLVQPGCPSSGVLGCELLCQHFLCPASHWPLLQGFPSFWNMLMSFVLSSPFLIILKHLLFLNASLVLTAWLKLYYTYHTVHPPEVYNSMLFSIHRHENHHSPC